MKLALSQLSGWAIALSIGLALPTFAAAPKPPVLIGADLELSDKTSHADDAIILGIRTAIDEINRAGGVLGGRRLELVTMDNGAMPARGRENVSKMLEMPNLVAYFVGKFSPVALDQVDLVNTKGLVMLDPWAAVDTLVDNGASPNYVFRLSLRDTWAVRKMVDHARSRGLTRLGVLAPANAWGRSCLQAIETHVAKTPEVSVVAVQSYYWGGEKSLARYYETIRDASADVVLLIANEGEGALLLREVATLVPEQRLPIISHWGLVAGRMNELAGPALDQVDVRVVHTRNLIPPRNAAARRLARIGMEFFRVDMPEKIPALPGLANSYDLTHLLAQAINRAGSTDRAAIRNALEKLGPHDGVVRHYKAPFTRERHEALSPEDLMFSRLRADGRATPVNP